MVLLQGMRVARACLKAVNAESKMLNGLGTSGTLVTKLPDESVKGWFGYLDEHASKVEEVVFQQRMDREGGRAVPQKVAMMSICLTHGRLEEQGPPDRGSHRRRREHNWSPLIATRPGEEAGLRTPLSPLQGRGGKTPGRRLWPELLPRSALPRSVHCVRTCTCSASRGTRGSSSY